MSLVTINGELYHYGVKGMKWGRRKGRKNYASTGIRSAIARRQNEKVDASFDDWKKNSELKKTAIEAGKKANLDRMAYEKNKSDKVLKSAYKQSSKEYKKALQKNTTYRKGDIKKEVGSDLSRKYMSEAKKVYKQLEKDPDNKQLKKQYGDLMSKHDVERAKARRAPQVAANRSIKKASIKRAMTMTVKTAATTAAVTVGVGLVKKYASDGTMNLNADQVMEWAKKGKNLMRYF